MIIQRRIRTKLIRFSNIVVLQGNRRLLRQSANLGLKVKLVDKLAKLVKRTNRGKAIIPHFQMILGQCMG